MLTKTLLIALFSATAVLAAPAEAQRPGGGGPAPRPGGGGPAPRPAPRPNNPAPRPAPPRGNDRPRGGDWDRPRGGAYPVGVPVGVPYPVNVSPVTIPIPILQGPSELERYCRGLNVSYRNMPRDCQDFCDAYSRLTRPRWC